MGLTIEQCKAFLAQALCDERLNALWEGIRNQVQSSTSTRTVHLQHVDERSSCIGPPSAIHEHRKRINEHVELVAFFLPLMDSG